MAKRVIALGGNALVNPKVPSENIDSQFTKAKKTLEELLPYLVEGETVLTHGNGPQSGYVLLRSEYGRQHGLHTIPVDVAVADTQAGMALLIEKAYSEVCTQAKIRGDLTHAGHLTSIVPAYVEVDPNDPAFRNYTKPIGPYVTQEDAEKAMRDNPALQYKDKGKNGWRRVVASPIPTKTHKLDQIVRAMEHNELVIASGGGGIARTTSEDGSFYTHEAVVDKDRASGVLAAEVSEHYGEAVDLIILTDADAAYQDFEKPGQQRLAELTPEQAEEHLGEFNEGGMLPKMQAAIEYVKRTKERGGKALITNIVSLDRAFEGNAGTWIRYAA